MDLELVTVVEADDDVHVVVDEYLVRVHVRNRTCLHIPLHRAENGANK